MTRIEIERPTYAFVEEGLFIACDSIYIVLKLSPEQLLSLAAGAA